MTTNIASHAATAQAVPEAKAPYQNGIVGERGLRPTDDRTGLPTFPLDVGWREVIDHEQDVSRQIPLTLLDILYPTDDDVGVVFMAQSLLHDIWTRVLAVMLQSHLTVEKWLVTHDVLIHWGHEGVPPKAPDIAAMPGGRLAPREKSYRTGRDGPRPAFVIEITSEKTREVDLDSKKTLYEAVGVKEFLIIDLLPDSDDENNKDEEQDWQLFGYRLEDNPLYQVLAPDVEGGITFETVGLRFVAVGHSHINVYDVATGERLLTPDEQKAFAESAAVARAKAEEQATAAIASQKQTEQQLREYETKLRKAGLL